MTLYTLLILIAFLAAAIIIFYAAGWIWRRFLLPGFNDIWGGDSYYLVIDDATGNILARYAGRDVDYAYALVDRLVSQQVAARVVRDRRP